MNFINCIAILLVLAYTSAKPTAFDELVDEIVSDVMDKIRKEKHDPSQDCRRECSRTNNPICADNGRMYPSICHMEKASCYSKKPISVEYVTKCNIKQDERKTVCGSDYTTYPDRCTMEESPINCKTKGKITVLHEGKCKDECARYAKTCEFVPKVQVCGSDGKTYESNCMMRAFNCEEDKTIKVVKCNNKECPSECPSEFPCDVYSPICGSDGKTYNNQCQLILSNLKSIEEVTRSHAGKCTVEEELPYGLNTLFGQYK